MDAATADDHVPRQEAADHRASNSAADNREQRSCDQQRGQRRRDQYLPVGADVLGAAAARRPDVEDVELERVIQGLPEVEIRQRVELQVSPGADRERGKDQPDDNQELPAAPSAPPRQSRYPRDLALGQFGLAGHAFRRRSGPVSCPCASRGTRNESSISDERLHECESETGLYQP